MPDNGPTSLCVVGPRVACDCCRAISGLCFCVNRDCVSDCHFAISRVLYVNSELTLEAVIAFAFLGPSADF